MSLNNPAPPPPSHMPLDEAVFWIALTVFGTGLYFVNEHPIWGGILMALGALGLLYSLRKNWSPPSYRVWIVVVSMLVTTLTIGYDIYDRHTLSPPAIAQAPPKAAPIFAHIDFLYDSRTPLILEITPTETKQKLDIFIQTFLIDTPTTAVASPPFRFTQLIGTELAKDVASKFSLVDKQLDQHGKTEFYWLTVGQPKIVLPCLAQLRIIDATNGETQYVNFILLADGDAALRIINDRQVTPMAKWFLQQ